MFGGEMYETTCSSAWRLRKESGIKGFWAKTTIKLLNMFEIGHCRKSNRIFLQRQHSIEESIRFGVYLYKLRQRMPQKWLKDEITEILEDKR